MHKLLELLLQVPCVIAESGEEVIKPEVENKQSTAAHSKAHQANNSEDSKQGTAVRSKLSTSSKARQAKRSKQAQLLVEYATRQKAT